MERTQERLARLGVTSFADDSAFRVVAARKEQQLALRDAECPHVAASGHDDDALHETQFATEIDALRRRQRLPILVEHCDRLASVTCEPSVVPQIDGSAESTALHAASSKSRRDRRNRLSIGVE